MLAALGVIALILGIIVSIITVIGFLQGEPTLAIELPAKLIRLIDLAIECLDGTREC